MLKPDNFHFAAKDRGGGNHAWPLWSLRFSVLRHSVVQQIHDEAVEEAGYVEIEKTFKGKRPLTVCCLTPKGEEALSGYSRRLIRALQANQNPKER